MKFLIGNR